MKSSVILLLFIFSTFVLSIAHPHNEVKLIVDIINSYDRPTAVIGKLCWKAPLIKSLAFQLNSLQKPKTIRLINKNGRMLRYKSTDVVIVLFDLNCPDIIEFFMQTNSTNMFRSPHRCIMIGKPINESGIVPTELDAVNALTDSEVIVSQPKSEDISELYLVYKIKVDGAWYIEYYGAWTKRDGFRKNEFLNPSMPFRRRDLSKEPIATSFVISFDETKADLNDFSNTHDALTKWGYRQTTPLYDFMNATRVIVFTDNWGYLINGSWNGMIGNINRGEADIAGTPMFITDQRLDVVTYLTNRILTHAAFVFREPPLSYQNNLFLLPFETTVWYYLMGSIPVLMFVLYVNGRWEWILKTVETRDGCEMNTSDRKSKLNVSDIAMMIVSAITQQGSSMELKGTNGRVVVFILFLAFLLLYTSYSAYIVALLQSSSKQIRTLSDLLNSRLELGVENTAYNKHLFMTATESVRKAIYESKIAIHGTKSNFMSLQDGIKKLQSKPFAFHMDTGSGYKTVEKLFYEHEKCGLQEIAFLPPQKPWLSCSKSSPYAEIFKIGFYKIREHGLSDRENRLLFSSKPLCRVQGGSFDSVTIVDVYPALLMLLYGAILAFVLLGIEIIIHRRHRQVQLKSKQPRISSSSFDGIVYVVQH